ncbi:MAG TPA: heme ABC exporter ATP-binding protein CcmA [Acidimicrobiales bacterium]|nr:heme ABC exporter ATP-binding protein CcmA [Acidimicrobiales bacterium]
MEPRHPPDHIGLASGEPVVRLRSVVALLGGFPALAGADLTVETGEVVLLRGPNGAGKSTVLRVCAGLVPVARGEANVLGVDIVRDRTAVRRRVAMLGHAGFLYDDLTVRENVTFAVRAAGGDLASVDRALERLGLAGRLATTRAAALSAGQRRRTSLAALVARGAELWLLDEPHAGLDEEGRDLIDGVVRDATAAGSTVLIASHDTDRATALSTRVLTVAGGMVHANAGRVRVP